MMKAYTYIDVLMLEQANFILYLALTNNNTDEIKDAMTFVSNNIPFVLDEAIIATKRILYNKEADKLYFTSIKGLFGSYVSDNALGYLLAINSILQKLYPKTFPIASTRTIYYPIKPFQSTDIIYESKGLQLKVADLTSVIRYAIKIVKAILPDLRTEEVHAAITVFTSIVLALNNQKQDKPLNKTLHLANEFLTSVVKDRIKEDEGKTSIIITSF